MKENILFFETLGSTNDYAMEHIAELKHLDVVMTDCQENGRGRMNRQWVSDSGENLYMTLVVKPDLDFRKLPLINVTQLVAVIICEILSGYGVVPQIKWPNDILINRAKICGILSEVSFRGASFQGMACGIGLNLGASPEGRLDRIQAVTCLKKETSAAFCKQAIVSDILARYKKYEFGFYKDGFSSIKDSFISFFPYIGETIEITNSSSSCSGKVVGLSDDGELLVDTGDGAIQKILQGEM